MPGQSAAPALAELLTDRDDNVVTAALKALKEIGGEVKLATPVLVKLLRHRNLQLRLSAVVALENIGPLPREAVFAVIDLLKDANLANRLSTCRHWTRSVWWPSKQTPARNGQSTADNIPFRLQAADTAEKPSPCPPATVRAIVLLMRDRTPAVRKIAERAWDLLDANDIPSIRALVASDNDRMAVSKLGDLGECSMPVLSELLKSDDQEVRRTALHALGQLGRGPRPLCPRCWRVCTTAIGSCVPRRRSRWGRSVPGPSRRWGN